MERMNLGYAEKVDMLSVTKEEVERLLALLDMGETLYYESEKIRMSLSPDGVMHIDDCDTVPMIFGVESEDGYIESDATLALPLKKRVKRIVFGERTRIICYRSFERFTELTKIEIPDTLERIVSPFEGCKKLRPYALPSSLDYISGDAFGIFPEEVILPTGVREINGLFTKSPVRAVTLSPAIKRIGMRDFYSCKRLEKITFVEGLEAIAEEAFSNCDAIKELHFPKSLMYIDAFAFSHCSSISRVTVTGDTEIDGNAFRDTPFHAEVQRLRFDAFTPIAYEGDASIFPRLEEMKAHLAGMPLSEQARHYKLLTRSDEETFAYGIEENGRHYGGKYPLGDESDVENLILLDGVIVGAIISGVSVMLDNDTCIYSASEDDGVGTRSRSDYAMIVFEA